MALFSIPPFDFLACKGLDQQTQLTDFLKKSLISNLQGAQELFYSDILHLQNTINVVHRVKDSITLIVTTPQILSDMGRV